MVIMINQESLDCRRILSERAAFGERQADLDWLIGRALTKAILSGLIRSASTHKTYIDNFRTPHTEKLHVVERFRMIDDGNILEANIRIEDPGAFVMPWNAVSTLASRTARPHVERVLR